MGKKDTAIDKDPFSAKKSDGTRFAEKHLAATFKKRGPDGQLEMLKPPPLRLRKRFQIVADGKEGGGK